MSKKIYDLAFENLEIERRMSNHFKNSGLSFEYGSGFWGENLEAMLSNNHRVIQETLGLHMKEYQKRIELNGESCIVNVYVFHTEDENSDFAITFDDFYNLVDCAIRNMQLRDLFWNAIVEKDLEAKNLISSLFEFKVGVDTTKFI